MSHTQTLARPTTPAAGAAPRILCIDDDPAIVHCIALALRRYSVDVLRAYHGQQGYFLALTEKPDLIITDLTMPQGDGEYILDCLKQNVDSAQIPVVVLTGRRNETLTCRLERLGAAMCLTKPISVQALIAVVSQFVALCPRGALRLARGAHGEHPPSKMDLE